MNRDQGTLKSDCHSKNTPKSLILLISQSENPLIYLISHSKTPLIYLISHSKALLIVLLSHSETPQSIFP